MSCKSISCNFVLFSLEDEHRGPMVVMEAMMVRLPFAASMGNDSVLNKLVNSSVGVHTYASATVQVI